MRTDNLLTGTGTSPRGRCRAVPAWLVLGWCLVGLTIAAIPCPAATIVLDPGHGGAESGASAGGVYTEKRFTLSLARKIAARLAPAHRVELTRSSDVAVPPEERAAAANHLKADLFISLHAAVAPYCDPRSAAIYYHSGEHVVLPGEPSPAGTGGGSAAPRLWERQQQRHQPQSLQLAAAMKTVLLADGFDRVAIEPAPLAVLMGVDMPAVLVEVGCFHPATPPDLAALEARLEGYAGAIADAIQAGLRRLKR